MTFVQISGHWTAWSVFESRGVSACLCGRTRGEGEVVTIVYVTYARWATGDPADDEVDTYTFCVACGSLAKAELTLINVVERQIAERDLHQRVLRGELFEVEAVLKVKRLVQPAVSAQLSLPGISEVED